MGQKKDLFRTIAEIFTQAHGGDADTIDAALWEREDQKNSIIVDGLAIPHAMVEKLDKTYLGVLTLAEPIDYLEDNDADIIVFMLGPLEDRHNYLKLLANTANMCTKASLLERLREASSAQQVKDIIIDCDRAARSADS